MNQQSFIDNFFKFATQNRERMITAFKVFYFLLVTFLFIGGRSIFLREGTSNFFYKIGENAGQLALIFYVLTTIPGIARRFGIKHKLISILMIYRRYIGISMFMFLLIHYWILRGVDTFFHNLFPLPRPLFETLGFMAYILTFLLFLTSNDFSVKFFGKFWWWIHKLTYLIVWFIFLHVFLQDVSIWSILIGTTALLQIASHVWGRTR
jgi:DMSO/TMAO reductase YedYZ heme-binding membrane subunit